MQTPDGFRGAFRTDEAARALYAEGAGIYRIVPAAVAVPEDTDDLIALVRWAGQTGTPLVPRGAGSGMPGGNVGSGVVVDLTRGFRRGPLVDVDARIARAGASVTWQAVNDAAASAGLFLPPNPSSGRFCTIGGMVATNAAGARSLKYGATREWVEALEFVTADGEVGKTGGHGGAPKTAAERRYATDVVPWLARHASALEAARPQTRKNSSGYRFAADQALLPLLAGSEGTLAFVTAVELRLAPQPTRDITVLVPVRSLNELADRLAVFRGTFAVAIELLDRTFLDFARVDDPRIPADTEAVLLATLDQQAVLGMMFKDADPGVFITEDPEEAHELWQLRHRASPILAGLPDHQRSLQVVEDGCVPRDRLAEYIRGLRRIAAACAFEIVIFGHAGDGHVHANVLADVRAADLSARLNRCLADVSALQISLGGTTSGEHGDGRLRAPYLEPLYGATYVEACRKVKAAWDPKGILNPGVKLTADGSRLSADLLKVGAAAPALPAEIERHLRRIEQEAQWDVDRLSLLPAPEEPAV